MTKLGFFLAFLVPLSGIGVLTNFEGGSVGKVEQVSATHLRCAVPGQADQDHRNRQADWYYFELTNLPRQPITIDLVDLGGEYNYIGPAYSVTKGTRPVFSYDGVNWKHFSDDEVSWDPQEPHLTLHFTPERDHVWIAHVTPYTQKNLTALLDAFHQSPYLKVESVGHTVEGREIPLLTITNPKIPEAKKQVIWLMFRQHAWEANTSWTGDEAVRFLLSKDATAARIRDHFIYKIFPLCDPDGVADGGVRYNRHGYDLNRNWDTVDPQKTPEIAAQHQAILNWVDSGHHLDLYFSLHNTEDHEYLQAPAPFKTLGERLYQDLVATSAFNPNTPLQDIGITTTVGKPGRMTVAQGLFHDRQLPAMLMELMIEYDSKLGRVPTADDRKAFGPELVRATAAAVSDNNAYLGK